MNTCPICGQVNNCMMEKGLPVHLCWCNYVKVPEELLENVDTRDGCICKHCIEKYNNGELQDDKA